MCEHCEAVPVVGEVDPRIMLVRGALQAVVALTRAEYERCYIVLNHPMSMDEFRRDQDTFENVAFGIQAFNPGALSVFGNVMEGLMQTVLRPDAKTLSEIYDILLEWRDYSQEKLHQQNGGTSTHTLAWSLTVSVLRRGMEACLALLGEKTDGTQSAATPLFVATRKAATITAQPTQ